MRSELPRQTGGPEVSKLDIDRCQRGCWYAERREGWCSGEGVNPIIVALNAKF